MSQQLLPFYLLCDESYSMEGPPLQAINDSLPQIHNEIGSNPVVADKARLCLISFSERAEVLLELSDVGTLTSMPALRAKGGTSYGAAFDTLRTTIEQDVDALRSQGHTVYRPAVFFLSDGHPTDDQEWPNAYGRVTDSSWSRRPNILAFGFGDADEEVISTVGTVAAFMADGTMGPAEALREFATAFTRSIVHSASGARGLEIPEHVPGFRTVPLDTV